MKTKITLAITLLFLTTIVFITSPSGMTGGAFAQNIGINGNGNNAHPSALLDIDAVATPSLGLLIPRIALQALNVAAPVNSPANSLLVFNTASITTTPSVAVTPGYYYWDLPNNTWVRFAYNSSGSLGNAWTTLGNLGTNSSNNFLGTTDAQDMVFKTNNNERMRILSSGNIGIGTAAPTASLHIVATATNTGLQLQDGTQGTNKILVSDAAGKASWENINTVINNTNSAGGGGFGSNGYHVAVNLHKGSGNEGGHFVLLDDGSVLAWGGDAWGEIGNGSNNVSVLLPSLINLPGTCREIISEPFNTFFIMQNGDVYACGYNAYGQLGIGTSGGQEENPIKVLNVSNVIKLEVATCNFNAGTAQSVCALTSTGQLWCWGYNGYGQVGNGTTTNQTAPVLIFPNSIIDIEGAGDTYASFCAIKSDSSVVCWGYNGYGQLGIGNTVNKNTPQVVTGLTKVKHLQAMQLSQTGLRRCAIRNNGDLYCWGYNSNGQVGDGTTVNKLIPIFITSNVKQIALGSSSSFALKNNGDLYSWGYNGYGQLGLNNTTQQTSPQLINSISGIDTVIVCKEDSYTTAWAMKNNGNTVYGWGYSVSGQVGDGNSGGLNQNNAPTLINLTNVKKMTCSWRSSQVSPIALLKDGGVKCWGTASRSGGADGGSGFATYPLLIKR